MSSNHYELIIIGGGTVAFDGLREAQHQGLTKILLVEKEQIGGTCLNWG